MYQTPYGHRTVYTAGVGGIPNPFDKVKKAYKGSTWEPRVPSVISAEWYLDPSNPMGAVDTLVHVLSWIAILVFDHVLFAKADKWDDIVAPATVAADPYSKTYAMAALICSYISLGVILALLAVHRCVSKILRQTDSVFLGIITAGVRSSLFFTMVITLFTTGATVDRGEDWKNFTIVAIILKFYVAHIIAHNISKTGSNADQSAVIVNSVAGVEVPDAATLKKEVSGL